MLADYESARTENKKASLAAISRTWEALPLNYERKIPICLFTLILCLIYTLDSVPTRHPCSAECRSEAVARDNCHQ